jgi:hypothetical protein
MGEKRTWACVRQVYVPVPPMLFDTAIPAKWFAARAGKLSKAATKTASIFDSSGQC